MRRESGVVLKRFMFLHRKERVKVKVMNDDILQLEKRFGEARR